MVKTYIVYKQSITRDDKTSLILTVIVFFISFALITIGIKQNMLDVFGLGLTFIIASSTAFGMLTQSLQTIEKKTKYYIKGEVVRKKKR